MTGPFNEREISIFHEGMWCGGLLVHAVWLVAAIIFAVTKL